RAPRGRRRRRGSRGARAGGRRPAAGPRGSAPAGARPRLDAALAGAARDRGGAVRDRAGPCVAYSRAGGPGEGARPGGGMRLGRFALALGLAAGLCGCPSNRAARATPTRPDCLPEVSAGEGCRPWYAGTEEDRKFLEQATARLSTARGEELLDLGRSILARGE